ncbi:MAG TPA: prolipoprotein diacylglyceryl transferase, partial [Hyphomonadaceae bacterium]|nr:prolipoprotein diacylglyceryl transferase [Hyphomonadaceae bacterium]
YIVMVGRNAPLWREGQARPNAAIADDLLFYGALGVIGGGRLGSV